MSIRIASAAVLAFGLSAALPGVAFAQANVMKECGAEYQAAKAANTLGGKAWKDFLAECRTRHAASTPGAAPASAPTPATTAAPAATGTPAPTTTAAAPAGTASAPAKPASGGRQAMLERQRACAAEWKAQKVELRKATPDLKWPKFWSACNKRLKAAGR